MHPRMIVRFCWEVETQCKFIALASHDLEAALREPHEDEWIDDAWMALQTITVSAANVSKLCWGSREKRPEACKTCKPVRDALSLSDSSPLNDAKVRNGFEHFDEHIEKWAEDVLNGTRPSLYLSRGIGPSIVPIAQRHGKPIPSQFGNYDPETGRLEFVDRSISVPRIVAAAAELLPKARQVIDGH